MADIINNEDFVNRTVADVINELSGYCFTGRIKSLVFRDGSVRVDIMRNKEFPMFTFYVECGIDDLRHVVTEVLKNSDIWRTDFFELKKI